jgi:hypothetical protein
MRASDRKLRTRCAAAVLSILHGKLQKLPPLLENANATISSIVCSKLRSVWHLTTAWRPPSVYNIARHLH